MRIVIIGYGKMGKTIHRLALAKGHEIAAIIESDDRAFWENNLAEIADVAIEFTSPESGFENIHKCLMAGLPIVSGTTGWLEKMPEIIHLCNEKQGAFFYASNFSIGVNILFEINSKLGSIMDKYEQYAVEIEEIHHTQKKDAPSGTAITLANTLIKKLQRKTKWINQRSENPQELGIISRRFDQTPGTHVVSYHSKADTLEIRHVAHSRDGFSEGAIMAAEWLIGKKGVFGMKDLLGLGA